MNDYNDRIKKGFAIMNGVHGYEHAFIEDQPFEEADENYDDFDLEFIIELSDIRSDSNYIEEEDDEE